MSRTSSYAASFPIISRWPDELLHRSCQCFSAPMKASSVSRLARPGTNSWLDKYFIVVTSVICYNKTIEMPFIVIPLQAAGGWGQYSSFPTCTCRVTLSFPRSELQEQHSAHGEIKQQAYFLKS